MAGVLQFWISFYFGQEHPLQPHCRSGELFRDSLLGDHLLASLKFSQQVSFGFFEQIVPSSRNHFVAGAIDDVERR